MTSEQKVKRGTVPYVIQSNFYSSHTMKICKVKYLFLSFKISKEQCLQLKNNDEEMYIRSLATSLDVLCIKF